MSACEEDIENNQETSKKSSFSLKNGLLAVGSLTVVVCLAFGIYSLVGNDGETDLSAAQNTRFSRSDQVPVHIDGQNNNIESNPAFTSFSSETMFFSNLRDMFSLDPSSQDLKCKLLLSMDNYFENCFRLSKDRKHLFFINLLLESEFNQLLPRSIKELNIENGTVVNVNLPGAYPSSGFILKKPDLDSIIYTARAPDGTYTINNYSLVDRNLIKDYNHECGIREFPIFLEQFSDGSKIFYYCNVSEKVFLKNLNNSEEEDKEFELLDRKYCDAFIISPDNTKVILHNFITGTWTLIDISDPTIVIKPIRFDQNLLGKNKQVMSHSFSNDQKTLFLITKLVSDTSYMLFSINFEDLLKAVELDRTFYVSLFHKISMPEN